MTDDKPVHLTGTDARGGEIILRSRRRRRIFVAGLIGLAVVLVALFFSFW